MSDASRLAAGPSTPHRRQFRSRSVARMFMGAVAFLACVSVPADGRLRSQAGDVITGGERLEWDQQASSWADLQQYQFALDVDGIRTALSDVTCGAGSTRTSFVCSGTLPGFTRGVHVLQLTASRGGAESPRSTKLTIAAEASRTLLAQVAPRRACFEETCFAVESVAALDGAASSPTVAPDGRLFFIEDRRHVRVVANGALLSQPAFSTSSARQQLTGLSFDPSFESSRVVYVSWLEQAPSGGGTLHVARFRELENRLAQPAVILTDIPSARLQEAPLLQDSASRLYVALPSVDPLRLAETQGGGQILRFTAEGMVPWESGQSSPVLLNGYPSPTATAFDEVGQRVWIAGIDEQGRPVLGSISATDPLSRAFSTSTEGTAHALATEIRSMTVAGGRGTTQSRHLVFVDTAGTVYRRRLTGRVDGGAPQPLVWRGSPATAVAAGGGDDLFVITVPLPPATGSFVFRLSPL